MRWQYIIVIMVRSGSGCRRCRLRLGKITKSKWPNYKMNYKISLYRDPVRRNSTRSIGGKPFPAKSLFNMAGVFPPYYSNRAPPWTATIYEPPSDHITNTVYKDNDVVLWGSIMMDWVWCLVECSLLLVVVCRGQQGTLVIHTLNAGSYLSCFASPTQIGIPLSLFIGSI